MPDGRFEARKDKIKIKRAENDLIIALAGNPNVGKSTLFNALTGLNRHTGNWTGKTVSAGEGVFTRGGQRYILADLPGTYSLFANSKEEAEARDYILFEKISAVAVVCDASCLERNLNLVLQTLEITPNVIVCVNLMDEAEKKKIEVDTKTLEEILGVPVCPMSAGKNVGINEFLDRLPEAFAEREYTPPVIYPDNIEKAVRKTADIIRDKIYPCKSERFVSLRILDCDGEMKKTLSEKTNVDFESESLTEITSEFHKCQNCEFSCGEVKDTIVETIIRRAEEISDKCVRFHNKEYYEHDRKIDRILTHKIFGVPVMALLLLLIFWITVSGANYPSELMSKGFAALGDILRNGMEKTNAPDFLTGVLIDGIYRVLSWVVAVMLPPMAIFFPLFTILEDSGYLPRMAFNLDRYFKKSGACGKQALTMAMGLGCNAAGITGCRIIDSPRERLIAMLTNVFMPCNGKYPTLIALITIFFLGGTAGGTFFSALILTGLIILGVLLTLLASKILSVTVLKGEQSAFTLELPSYRKPKILEVIVRSLIDRTAAVLGRAVCAAAPAGLIIWLAANIRVDGETILHILTDFLDPFGRFLGLDGTILIAFVLGFPANEIVLPIMLTAYTSSGVITDYESLSSLREILVNNGWTVVTAVCTLIFMLCHFPCATSCMTVKKESGKFRWAFAAFVIPTLMGMILCAVTAAVMRLFL